MSTQGWDKQGSKIPFFVCRRAQDGQGNNQQGYVAIPFGCWASSQCQADVLSTAKFNAGDTTDYSAYEHDL